MRRIVPLLLFLLCILATFLLSPSISVAWDEPDNIYAGGIYIKFFQNGFNPSVFLDPYNRLSSHFGDKLFTQNASLERYPPVPLYVGNMIALFFETARGMNTSKDIIYAFHIATGMFFGLIVMMTYLLGRRLRLSFHASLLSSLAIFLHPTMFGHGFSNIKDTAQVALFVTSLYFLISYVQTNKKRFFLFGAIVWGLALATKFNAVYVPVIWIAWYLCIHISKPFNFPSFNSIAIKLVAKVGMLVMLGIGTALIVWPYLWFDPIPRIRSVIEYFTTVGTGYAVFWEGQKYMVGIGQAMPWYPIGYILLSTPLVFIFFSIAGGSSLGLRIVKERKKQDIVVFLLLFFWMTIPLIRSFFSRTSFYDGIRHFMEILPPFSLFVGVGIESVSLWFRKIQRDRLPPNIESFRYWILPISFIVIMSLINIRYVPYGTGYLNEFVSHPNEQFDRDFFGLSVKEGIEYLHEHHKNIKVYVPIAGHLSWYYLEGTDQYVYSFWDADSILFINKGSHATKKELEDSLGSLFILEHTIQRGDAVFGWVYRRKE